MTMKETLQVDGLLLPYRCSFMELDDRGGLTYGRPILHNESECT